VTPLLNKIVGKILTLKDYSLSIGIVKALAIFFEANPFSVERLNLSSNNVNAAQIKIIIDALPSLSYFKSLIVHENEIDLINLPSLGVLLNKKMPENLEHLRISHCKINWRTTQELLETIKQRCFLKKLELIEIKMNGESVQLLIDIIHRSKSITSLDISWNKLKTSDMFRILQVLSKNRRLEYLNLSWNGIVDQASKSEEQEEIL